VVGAGADHGSAIVTDLGSTNGPELAQPGLDPEELTPGIAVSLIPGAVLDLGDGPGIVGDEERGAGTDEAEEAPGQQPVDGEGGEPPLELGDRIGRGVGVLGHGGVRRW